MPIMATQMVALQDVLSVTKPATMPPIMPPKSKIADRSAALVESKPSASFMYRGSQKRKV